MSSQSGAELSAITFLTNVSGAASDFVAVVLNLIADCEHFSGDLEVTQVTAVPFW
jgi:hypothetical protein